MRVGDDLRRRLVGLHRLGRHGYLRLFLSLRPDVDGLLPAIRQLRFLVRRDRDALQRYTAIRNHLGEVRLTLEAQRARVTAWRTTEVTRRDEIAEVRARQARLLARAQRTERDLAQQAQALIDKETKLAELIQLLIDQDTADDPLAGAPMTRYRGALDWPLGDGEQRPVALGFGPRRDPRYRTLVPHNGIDLEAPVGTPVRVVYPGEVLYASTFEGYGPMVVVRHPGRVFTLYAGLERIQVARGDVLSLGDLLGPSSARIYFEIRRDRQPEDPLGWLR
ncbi:MAG: peptidoglycan DD-metalloendopeptidase family protein [Acidobacteriota bacterium]